MTYHILTGDALLHSFPKGKLNGSLIIIRECLLEGPVQANSISELFETRKKYLNQTYPQSNIDYNDDVIFEFEKFKTLSDGDELNFWFEHDLFCQVNLWFSLALLPEKKLNLFRVSPLVQSPKYLWHGFGPMGAQELMNCFKNRIVISNTDLALGKNLWSSYAAQDMDKLYSLSKTSSACFPYLKEVCQAQIERNLNKGELGRPERSLYQIIKEGNETFEDAFQVFSEREGIYGFGDLQVKKIYDQLIS